MKHNFYLKQKKFINCKSRATLWQKMFYSGGNPEVFSLTNLQTAETICLKSI